MKGTFNSKNGTISSLPGGTITSNGGRIVKTRIEKSSIPAKTTADGSLTSPKVVKTLIATGVVMKNTSNKVVKTKIEKNADVTPEKDTDRKSSAPKITKIKI